jgi:multidrug efflux pump subunit AcrA (membrane-fusion protein)
MKALLAASLAVTAGVLAGCGQDNRYVAPPPPNVTVMTPVQRSITRYFEATGNTAAVNSANLVARVSGFLQAVNYKDGEEVKAGTTLFTIEQAAIAGGGSQRRGVAQAARGGISAPARSVQPQHRLQGPARDRNRQP